MASASPFGGLLKQNRSEFLSRPLLTFLDLISPYIYCELLEIGLRSPYLNLFLNSSDTEPQS